jgi:hypothetical protein
MRSRIKRDPDTVGEADFKEFRRMGSFYRDFVGHFGNGRRRAAAA